MNRTGILLIEDEPRVADSLQRALSDAGYLVELAGDGDAGLTAALKGSHQLIITDIILPGINGIELCRRIRHAIPDMPIIMLTALGTTDEKVEGFDSGANDYLVKPFEMRELLARIRALLKRSQPARNEPVLRAADLELDLRTKSAKRGGREIELTPKEFKLLSYLLEHQGRVLSREEIAEKVWDTHFDTGTNFIDVYVAYLRKKVDKEFSPKLIHTRPGLGFILKAE